MSPHILVVDDDAMVLGYVRLTLENQGYRVSEAGTAGQMRAEFQKGGIDLIFLDLELTGGDGLQLVSEIRAVSAIPIIALSASPSPADRTAALEHGASDYLTKPFDPMDLLARVRKLLVRGAQITPSTQETTPPQKPIPKGINPEAATPVVEPSLQLAAKKPLSPGPSSSSDRATGKVDTSVILAGVLAAAAFGGASLYFLSEPGSGSTISDSDGPSVVLERSSGGFEVSRPPLFEPSATATPRRGALQPPVEPDVEIAGLSAEQQREADDSLTRSVTTDPVVDTGPLAWVAKTKCAALPDVAWWRVKSHRQVVAFVDETHDSNWRPYLNNWRGRIKKLQDAATRGLAIKTGSGEILTDQSLARYIRDTANRISVIQCLSREARIAKKAQAR